MTMNEEIKKRWVSELRSNKFKQGRQSLEFYNRINDGSEFCCLGVLCHLAVEAGIIERYETSFGILYGNKKFNDSYDEPYVEEAYLPEAVITWAGLDANNPDIQLDHKETSLAALNDDGKTFLEIADIIEREF